MKAPGLSKAMRRDMVGGLDLSPKRLAELVARGFLPYASNDATLTPRGHSALSAPAMTRKEYEYLEFVDHGHWRTSFSAAGSRVRWRLIERLWVKCGVPDTLTPSGSKALNDMRAAEGSEEWKP